MNSNKITEGILALKKEFGDKLLNLSKGISFDWLYHNRENINTTQEFDNLVRLLPPLEDIFRKGLKEDYQEFIRTLIHTFQTQAVYNRIFSGEFPESGLDGTAIREVYNLSHSISSSSSILMPLILWLHDIGRLEDKRRHNEKSAEMISELNILSDKGLSEKEAILIRKVVQYHLLIGTLYTGESSYLGFEPLLKDNEFQPILTDNSSIKLFVDALTLFTMIDVWGYHKNDISTNMIDNYFVIRQEMEQIFAKSSNLGEIIKGLRDKSRKHLDWRLMGYMMAFSKIGKKPHLTLDFYADMINDGFKRYAEREGLSIDWNSFKDRYLNKFDQIQFKYGLGVLIPLSYGETGKKMHLTDDTRVNPNLFHLLVKINSRIQKEEDTNTESIPNALWYVVFKGYPLWNQKTDFYQRLNEPGQIEEIIDRGKVSVDKKEGLNVLSIDYRGYWKDVEN
ncbi:MAG: hypothetical protein ABIJ37_04410 [Pseudomonadota bacterium]